MWLFFTVFLELLFRLFTNFVQTRKHLDVEYRLAVGAIESFDENRSASGISLLEIREHIIWRLWENIAEAKR